MSNYTGGIMMSEFMLLGPVTIYIGVGMGFYFCSVLLSVCIF